MALGIVQEAQTAAAVLGHNFPDSPWYQDAYNLVRAGGVEPRENQGSWISRAFKKLSFGSGSAAFANALLVRSHGRACPGIHVF